MVAIVLLLAIGSWPLAFKFSLRRGMPRLYVLLLRFTSGGLLGCLQRIQSCRPGESATLLRRLLRLIDQHVSVFVSRNRALHHQQVVLFIDGEDAQVADRLGIDAHVS